jgi:hypothetical protein
MGRIAQVAQAVTDELNGATLSLSFTAERRYAPQYELADMDSLHVTVVPKELTVATAGRSAGQFDCAVDVAVQKRFSTDAPSEIDPLMDLAEEIAEFFRGRRLSALPSAAWVKTEHKPIFAPEHMQEFRQFSSVITLTFRLFQ